MESEPIIKFSQFRYMKSFFQNVYNGVKPKKAEAKPYQHTKLFGLLKAKQELRSNILLKSIKQYGY